MLRKLDLFYLQQPEPNRSFFLGLRDFFMDYSEHISEEWKYKLPFFYYKNKPLCYLWKDSKTQQPYLGVVKANQFEHPLLIKGSRKRMKVLYFDVNQDIPIALLDEILQLSIRFL